ncbi:MAG: HAD-IA family hydrolase [Actinomycetota bacterium]
MHALRWPVVLFDLDGTVLDTVELIRASHAHAVREVLGIELPDEELMAGIGTPLREQMEVFSPERADELFHVYRAWNHANTARLIERYPGVDEVLVELEQEGARLGIVTSKMLDAVELAFAALPPPIVWDVVITTEDTPLHKPHPAPLLAALERVGGTPAEAAYVGDSPFDRQAARAAGTAAIGVTWGAFGRAALEAEEPLVVVDTPAQLLEALAG